MSRCKDLSILFVDDELYSMRPTIEALECEGATVQIATDGTEAIRFLQANRQSPPDVIILDIMMPEGPDIQTQDEGRTTGVEVFKRMKSEYGKAIPTIVSSVVTDDAILQAFRSERRVRIVTKPYRFEELVRALEQVLAE